jgi:hypothetical protein
MRMSLGSNHKVPKGKGICMTSHLGSPARLMGLAAPWLLAACSAAGPDESPLLRDNDRGPAVLAFYGDTTSVELAASTRVGEATTVRFTSFGGGCIRRDTTVAEVSGLSAKVRSYRLEPTELPPNTSCTSELRLDQNEVHLRFVEPGRAVVRIIGLSRPGDQQFVIERELQVTP